MATKTYTDQLGRQVEIPLHPSRIVSVVPSQTELLFDLGLDNKTVGVTWFCIHPKEKVKGKAKVGGTKNLKLDVIRELRPDLIIANKEENERKQIEALAKEFPVWVSDINSIEDSLVMITSLGELTDKAAEAKKISDAITEGFSNLPTAPPLKTIYLIWREPYMSIGRDTFIHHILEKCGLRNVLDSQSRYPELSIEQIKKLQPELVLLSSEPYPFKDKHIEELQNILPSARIMLVDGEIFSWYGSRLIQAADYLKSFVGQLSD